VRLGAFQSDVERLREIVGSKKEASTHQSSRGESSCVCRAAGGRCPTVSLLKHRFHNTGIPQSDILKKDLSRSAEKEDIARVQVCEQDKEKSRRN